LYVGAVLFDSDPDHIVAQYLEQDFDTHSDDVFGVTLDPFLDRRNSFMFLVNPRGAVKDGQTFDNSRTANLAWEGVIEVKTSIHDRGWTVELAIPFTTLRYDPRRENQSWGVNFLRRLRRRNEDSYWAPLDRRSRVHTMALAGTLTGLSGLPRPRNLTIKPFVLADHSGGDVVPDAVSGADWDGGMDLKYGVTSRLTLDLTYRTDFSQVEVDQERVNLTRFSLFFPEKRDFFVENAGLFTFGDLSERNYRMGASPRDFTLFHSRRIGLYQGRPVPIVAGGRLTGRVGSFDVGFLNMQTEATPDLSRELFSVARVRRSFGGVIQVGGLVASRDGLGSGTPDYNRSYGVDANLRIRDKLLIHSYLSATQYPGREGNNRAARVSAAFRDRLWDISALYREIGDAFDPGIGFVARRGIRHTYGTVGAHPRPAIPHVNELNPYLELDYITNLESALETRKGTVGLGVAFLDGGALTFSASDRLEVIDEAFPVAGRGLVSEGRYSFREGSLGYRSNAARHLSGEVRVSGGGFYDGSRRSISVGGGWRPSPHFGLELGVERNEIDLPDDSFTADVLGARVDLAGSTRSFLSAFFQYNTASEDRVINLRYNFIHSPLSDLFIVYSQRQNPDEGGVLERTVTLKATKLLSF
ncbi:MAG: carbohydrate binding family 9 domain-containing protein, partial [Gemmatimonadetes bacterium]|nr:carbohydrate binding family 9 domain-containing protein [Gemmatimonadota bacterium]